MTRAVLGRLPAPKLCSVVGLDTLCGGWNSFAK